MWRYREPSVDDYETDEEYEDACKAYDFALDMYIEDCLERERES